MEYAFLPVKLLTTAGTIIGQHTYYYQVPIFEVAQDGVTLVVMTKQRARQLFLLDGDRHKKLLPELPADGGCVAYVKLGDLQIPIPDVLSATVSVLRINHSLRVGESFTILAELQNWRLADKPYVEVVGINGTPWSVAGRYPMLPLIQQFPSGTGLQYSWQKQFGPLNAGDSVEYRVYANDQTTYLSGQIIVDNDNVANGPVWGNWLPKIVQVGAEYSEQLPADAAIGTGSLIYNLIDAPAWYSFASNTRNISGTPPGSIPSTEQKVTYRAFDSHGSTDKTFTLQFASVLDMVMGWGFENVPGGSKLYLGLGPNDDAPYTTKLTALAGGTGWSDTGAHTAERVGIGLNSVSYPWRSSYDNVPVGVYLVETTRANGQKRYALLTHTGLQSSWTLDLSTVPLTYTPAGDTITVDGDDVLANAGSNDGSLNEGVTPDEKILVSLTPSGPASVTEGSSIQLGLIATYNDSSTVNVITQAVGSVSGTGASLATSGILSAAANSVASDTHSVTINFSYGGLTASKTVSIVDATVVATLDSIAIVGLDSAAEGTNPVYHIIGTFSDNSTADVTVSASKNGGTNATILSDGTLQVPAAPYLDDSRETTLTAAYGGKTASKTVAITDATPFLIAAIRREVRSDTVMLYVKTSPPTRPSGAAPVRQLYYRLKTVGGNQDAGFTAWSESATLYPNAASNPSGQFINSPTAFGLNFFHLLYGNYYAVGGGAYTLTVQFSTSPSGSNPIEVVYAMAALSTHPTDAGTLIYPPAP